MIEENFRKTVVDTLRYDNKWNEVKTVLEPIIIRSDINSVQKYDFTIIEQRAGGVSCSFFYKKPKNMWTIQEFMRDAGIIQGNLIASGARSFTRKIFSFHNNIDC